MRTRELIFSLAAALGLTVAACSVSVNEDGGEEAALEESASAGWTFAVIGAETGPKRYLIIRPDGRQAAAEAADCAARIVDAGDVHAAMSEGLAAEASPGGDHVRIKAPFINLEVTEGGESDGSAKVNIGAGDARIEVNAAGETGQAVVRISGADEDDARKFIDDADGLSPEVRQQLKDALEL